MRTLENKAISDYELFLKKRDELKSEEEELTSKAETTTEDAERDKVYKDLATVKTELLSYDGKEDELKRKKPLTNDVKRGRLGKGYKSLDRYSRYQSYGGRHKAPCRA